MGSENIQKLIVLVVAQISNYAKNYFKRMNGMWFISQVFKSLIPYPSFSSLPNPIAVTFSTLDQNWTF